MPWQITSTLYIITLCLYLFLESLHTLIVALRTMSFLSANGDIRFIKFLTLLLWPFLTWKIPYHDFLGLMVAFRSTTRIGYMPVR